MAQDNRSGPSSKGTKAGGGRDGRPGGNRGGPRKGGRDGLDGAVVLQKPYDEQTLAAALQAALSSVS